MKAYKIVAIVVAIAVSVITLTSIDFGGDNSMLSATTGSLNATSEYVKPTSAAVSGSNKFGIDLLKESFDSKVNTVVSPTSLYLAFAMLYNGASADTQRQMYETMNISVDLETFNENMKSLQQSLLAPRTDTIINLANSIWIRDSFKELVNASFLQNNAEYFGAMIEACDFSDPKTIKAINSWVKENTNGLIDSIVDDIDPDMMMYLINTVYLKAKWQVPFEAALTTQKDFSTSTGTIQVDTMQNEGSYEFYKGDGVKAIKLPYTDGRSHMLVVLPDGNIEDFVTTLSAEYLEKINLSLKYTSVRLELPKVDIATEIHPIAQLSKMGMADIFDSRADFTGISAKAKELGLCVGDVIHKTVLKIDESGTEAAAVTAIGVKTTSIIINQEEMIVDRPFFVAIIDDEAGIIFAGTIVNPLN